MAAGVTCVFSGLAGANAGGVQASGRVAWEALAHRAAVRGGANLFVFGEAEPSDHALATGRVFVGGKRWRAVVAAALRDWRAEVLLFWHVGTLRLLPFLRPSRSRVVLFLHGTEVWRPFAGSQLRQLRRTDLFLVNSYHTWQRFLHFNPEFAGRPHRIVPLGLGEEDRATPPPPDRPPAALILGRVMRGEDYKGHRELIGVWPEVRRRVPSATLWVAGDGDLLADLKALTKGDGGVELLGRISDVEKARRLDRCRTLVMPSRGEGFGLVYLEAMRRGRPCLVSDADAGREVVNPPEAGLAVNPADSSDLTAAVARLLTDGSEWQAWSEAARRRYDAAFTAAHFQSRLLEALYGAAEASAARGTTHGSLADR
jgi:phosphatidyl-myo-inositol dimannoside synthase